MCANGGRLSGVANIHKCLVVASIMLKAEENPRIDFSL